MNTDLDNLTPAELAAEFTRLKSNHANRARESAARCEALKRENPHLFDGHPGELKPILAKLNADLDAAAQMDTERMDALKAVLIARITAPMR